MTSTCFVFFIGCIALCRASPQIDAATIKEVFGIPKHFTTRAATDYPPGQAVAVTPETDNGYLVDRDYWDAFDYFDPNQTQYDAFDWTITKHVALTSVDNFLISPLGLKLAMAILTEAATGPTQNELSSVLGFDLDRDIVRRKFASIIESLQKESPQYVLNLGSRVYVIDTAQTRQMFAAIAQQFYKTDIKSVNFNNPPEATKEINTWVSNLTHGRIPDLVDEGDVANVLVLILSTLYFKGSWRHQFAPNATTEGVFYVSPEVQKTVPFMHVNNQFYCSESNKFDAKVLRMPYMGNKFAMYIIVPNTLMGLPRVLANLAQLRQELNNLREHSVDVTLPKFQFEYTSQLDEILKQMGVRHAFSEAASFPGIARGQKAPAQLRVSRVLQRSGVEVNELGSVAYSATQISLVNKFGEDSEVPVEVVANRPFLFFIQDEGTKQLLFTGRVADPTLEGPKNAA